MPLVTPIGWIAAQQKAARTARWAVTLVKKRITEAVSRTKWQLVTFCGESGAESVGIVDLMAIRKDHRVVSGCGKRGDNFEIILIQIKGGSAPMPTDEDLERLRAVKRRYHARDVLLGSWLKGGAPKIRRLKSDGWEELGDIDDAFR
ncbi:MAG: hypothetical protein WA208_18610 [Thermoanaerobaculia bacterium]